MPGLRSARGLWRLSTGCLLFPLTSCCQPWALSLVGLSPGSSCTDSSCATFSHQKARPGWPAGPPSPEDCVGRLKEDKWEWVCHLRPREFQRHELIVEKTAGCCFVLFRTINKAFCCYDDVWAARGPLKVPPGAPGWALSLERSWVKWKANYLHSHS